MYYRSRSHGGFRYATTQEEYATWSNCSMSSETLITSFPYVKVGEKKTFHDVVTPNFYVRSRKGDIIMSPMSMSIKSSVHDAGTGTTRIKPNFILCNNVLQTQVLRNKYWTGTHYYSLDSDGVITPTVNEISQDEISDLVLEYSTKVLAERCRPDNNLWETMAEFDKTLALIPNLMKGIRSRIPKGTVQLAAGTLAAAWLSYRYGVMPLIREVNAVVEGLKKKVEKIRETTRANSPQLLRIRNASKIGTGSTINHEFGEQHLHRVTIRCMSLDEYERTRMHSLGLDLSKLLTLPWELIPYSFVVDWFSNIGDYINSLVPQFGCRQLGSCVTVNEERSFMLTHLRDIPVGGYTITTPSHGSYKSTLLTRRRIVGPLQSRVVVRNDFRFKNMTRAMDSIALVVVRLRG